MSATATVIMVLLGSLTGFVIGWVCGETMGRDAQWCDDFFSAARKDRERRDKLGRFKARREVNAGNEPTRKPSQ